ncbi:MAG: FHA domain-containing protein [Herpetosiphonaceae bacterium]|nr:FHA domain-containing protein [Herpetosiphonaceae bacterium]
MTCPSCGHANDAGNRFCEYCGARLDPSTVQEATAQQIGPPSFGGDASYDAPTMFVPTESPAAAPDAPASPPPTAASPPAASGPAQTQDVICGVCGYANQPDDRFCDQCGASLQSAAQGGSAAPPAADDLTELAPVDSMPAAAGSDPALMSPWSTNDAEAPTPPQGTPLPSSAAAEPAPALASSESLLAEMVMSPISSHELPTTPVPSQESGEPAAEPDLAPVPGDTGDGSAERAAIEATIQEHRDNLAMFEQMATRYQGRAVPGHISAGLAESREALDQAEAELAALQGSTPDSPPAVAVTPPAEVTAPSEAELVASAPEPVLEASTAAAVPMPSLAPAESPTPAAATVIPPASPEPAPMPVLKPRLMIVASGATVELPTDKQTIVVGREDPISGIFPEVDLTPHGGEGGGVSRQHARILHDTSGWKVEDLNSTNYTKINGTKLSPNTPTEVHDGDTLHFGRVALTFHS